MSRPSATLPSPLPPLFDSACGATRAPALLDVLDALLDDRPRLHAALRTAAEDPDRAAAVAARSYWHPNGFAKIVLRAAEPRVRLHLWPPGSRGETNPHSHRWDFASAVLAGDGLTVTEHAEGAIGDAWFVRHSYGGEAVSARSVAASGAALEPSGRVRLEPVRRYRVAPLQRYLTDVSVVHTVEPLGSRVVATLLVQGPHRSASTVVYRPVEGGTGHAGQPLEVDDVRSLLGEVLAVLDPSGGAR